MKNYTVVLLLSFMVASCGAPSVSRFKIQTNAGPVKCIKKTQPVTYKTQCVNVPVSTTCFTNRYGNEICGPGILEVCKEILQPPKINIRCNDKLWNRVTLRKQYNDF